MEMGLARHTIHDAIGSRELQEMIESFTAGAGRALGRADRLARRRGAAVVEPVDLLAALIAETESRAAELLQEFGVDAAEIGAVLSPAMPAEAEVVAFAEETVENLETGDLLPASTELRAVLSEATMQARCLDRKREVGTEHLLAGLLSSSSPAADLLLAAGLELRPLLEKLMQAAEVESAPLPPAEGIAPLELTEPGEGVELSRILDASVNRAREGLRVVEDYVRFVLDDPSLTKRLKEIRHRLAEAERGLDANLLLHARDTSGDVGTHIMTRSEQLRENPRSVLAANFKRIAEALRSLEEYSKLVDVWIAGRFEVLRYDIYVVEKLIMTMVAAHRGLGDARLMVLAGGLPTLGDLTWIVEEALAGGADVIQLREKGLSDRELLRRSREVRVLTARARVPLIVNDRVDLALLARSDGVHLGQEDLPVRDARRIMGTAAHVGVSTHDRQQLADAILAGASYLGVGPVFPSPTKEFSEPELAGLAFVRFAAETTSLPWFAIGGINEENLERVLEAGATRVAVSGAVVHAGRPRHVVERLKACLEGRERPLEPAHDQDDDLRQE
jgi:thiamine-phosphate pyrophosphorylase